MKMYEIHRTMEEVDKFEDKINTINQTIFTKVSHLRDKEQELQQLTQNDEESLETFRSL